MQLHRIMGEKVRQAISDIILFYEWPIKKDFFLSSQADFLIFPNIADIIIANPILFTRITRPGIDFSTDYRYLPFARNRRPASDELYIGGYFSYRRATFNNKLIILNAIADQQRKMEERILSKNIH